MPLYSILDDGSEILYQKRNKTNKQNKRGGSSIFSPLYFKELSDKLEKAKRVEIRMTVELIP